MMGETLLMTLSIENYRPSTVLSMDSSLSSHDGSDKEVNRAVLQCGPPDINLPLSVELSVLPTNLWVHHCKFKPQVHQPDRMVSNPKGGNNFSKGGDS